MGIDHQQGGRDGTENIVDPAESTTWGRPVRDGNRTVSGLVHPWAFGLELGVIAVSIHHPGDSHVVEIIQHRTSAFGIGPFSEAAGVPETARD